MLDQLFTKGRYNPGYYYKLLQTELSITDQEIIFPIIVQRIEYQAVSHFLGSLSSNKITPTIISFCEFIWKHRYTVTPTLINEVFKILVRHKISLQLLFEYTDDFSIYDVLLHFEVIKPTQELEPFFNKFCEEIADSEYSAKLFAYSHLYPKINPDTPIYLGHLDTACVLYYEEIMEKFPNAYSPNLKYTKFKDPLIFYKSLQSVSERMDFVQNIFLSPNIFEQLYKQTQSTKLKQRILQNPNCPDSLKLKKEV